MTVREKVWQECFALARAEGALDLDSLLLVSAAIVYRDVESALRLLSLAGDKLEANEPLPRLIQLSIAYSLRSIALGADPATALHLKAGARNRTSSTDLMLLFYAVEWHKGHGASSEKEAIRLAGKRFGLKPDAAEKRYSKAKTPHGDFFKTMRSIGGAPRMPSLGNAVLGTETKSEAEDLIAAMVELIGAPKEGL
jgi:hypothetical protein